jgi:Nucleotidyltransferase of unknown function (DUF6036)
MRRYSRAELVTFLRALDENLTKAAELVVIGGAAATLRYGATSATIDIDTFENIPVAVHTAARLARTATGLDVPLEKAAVAEGPYHCQDRLRGVPLRFEKLTIKVPERHDLVLMKTVRAERHDLDVIEEIHRRRPLSYRTLVDRFETEMGHVLKDERIMRQQFRLLIDRLFGAAAAKAIRRTRVPPRSFRV